MRFATGEHYAKSLHEVSRHIVRLCPPPSSSYSHLEECFNFTCFFPQELDKIWCGALGNTTKKNDVKYTSKEMSILFKAALYPWSFVSLLYYFTEQEVLFRHRMLGRVFRSRQSMRRPLPESAGGERMQKWFEQGPSAIKRQRRKWGGRGTGFGPDRSVF